MYFLKNKKLKNQSPIASLVLKGTVNVILSDPFFKRGICPNHNGKLEITLTVPLTSIKCVRLQRCLILVEYNLGKVFKVYTI